LTAALWGTHDGTMGKLGLAGTIGPMMMGALAFGCAHQRGVPAATPNDDAKACYRSALTDRPALQGKVIVDVAVGPEGHVVGVAVPESTLGAPDVEACIVAAAVDWKLEPTTLPEHRQRLTFVLEPDPQEVPPVAIGTYFKEWPPPTINHRPWQTKDRPSRPSGRP